MTRSCSQLLGWKAKEWNVEENSLEFAHLMDKEDPLRDFRKLFHYPKKKTLPHVDLQQLENDDEETIYFCGHSLGLQLKSTESYLQEVLNNWAEKGVHSHFHGYLPAALCDLPLKEKMGQLVGAYEDEIVVMNGLTVNIHLLLASFYRPTPERYKILLPENGFPSDLYAVRSQITLHGYDPDDSIIFLRPRKGEYLLNPHDVQSVIENEGHRIAVIFLEAVHFYTGQLLDLKQITENGHKKGCVMGFDLAHAVGNVELHLHEWDIDFAVWCTYKYLNAGAGSLGSIFVHNKFTQNGITNNIPMFKGWWGVHPKSKFSMKREFDPAEGADRFKLSNPSPFLAAMVFASLEVFEEAGIDRLVTKQRYLTGYLEYLLEQSFPSEEKHTTKVLTIITPNNPKQRGCQLSIATSFPLDKVEGELKKRGIVCDIRLPSVIRITPVPLYNTFTEVYQFVRTLKEISELLAESHMTDIPEK